MVGRPLPYHMARRGGGPLLNFYELWDNLRLAEELDPERVRRCLTRYYEIAREAVEAHGGTVEKFVGDAVMAVFGLNQAHGDDAERGLSATLEIRDRVKEDSLLRGSLVLRFGVTTGEVVATRDSTARDFMVTGDVVNTAARLQQSAQPWEIIVGERTARSAAEFEFGPSLEAALKGKNARVAVRALLGRRKRVVAPTRMPLAGRVNELRQLRRLAERALQDREPNIVTIVEPAGAGKTRLVEEFLAWLPKLKPAGPAILHVLPTGRDATYGPSRQLLLQLLGVADDLGPARPGGRIRKLLSELGVERPERIAELLLATADSSLGVNEGRDELLGAWRDVVEASARSAPLVLVLEDLHLASDSALGLLEAAIRIRPPAPLLVIVLARPELHERRPGWPSTELSTTPLDLDPLSDRAVAGLAWHKAGIDAPAIIQLIVKRSAGNPFFASELARAARDRGPIESRAQLKAALHEIPDTVQATVLNRPFSTGWTESQSRNGGCSSLARSSGRCFPLRVPPGSILGWLIPPVLRGAWWPTSSCGGAERTISSRTTWCGRSPTGCFPALSVKCCMRRQPVGWKQVVRMASPTRSLRVTIGRPQQSPPSSNPIRPRRWSSADSPWLGSLRRPPRSRELPCRKLWRT